MVTSILVAGIGNVFKGDAAFGVEVARLLSRCELPAGVRVVDFGIRGIDLTYALLDPWAAAILIDTAQRGENPGTVSVMEPQSGDHAGGPSHELTLAPHELDPDRVLRLVASLGGGCKRVLVVACEPLALGGAEGTMGLSPPVKAAVEVAAKIVQQLIHELLQTSDSGTGVIVEQSGNRQRSNKHGGDEIDFPSQQREERVPPSGKDHY